MVINIALIYTAMSLFVALILDPIEQDWINISTERGKNILILFSPIFLLYLIGIVIVLPVINLIIYALDRTLNFLLTVFE